MRGLSSSRAGRAGLSAFISGIVPERQFASQFPCRVRDACSPGQLYRIPIPWRVGGGSSWNFWSNFPAGLPWGVRGGAEEARQSLTLSRRPMTGPITSLPSGHENTPTR